MAWYDQDSWLTQALSPKLSTIVITFAIALVLPILLHSFLYRKAAASTGLPTFLLAGPSGGGKTAFTTLTERGTVVTTHTSIAPLQIEALLPDPHVPASSHYRSPGDPAFERSRRFIIIDTPGHGKLRNYATSALAAPKNVCGIVFVVDAAAIDEEAGLNEAAEYLHDVLLSLQKRHTNAKTSKGPKDIPVLIAANKMDLFTALPASAIKSKLEKAIGAVRNNRAKALRDAGSKLTGEDDVDEEKEWLGEGGEGSFEFDQMRQVGTNIDVVGGNVSQGKNVGDVAGWWAWMGEHL
ncbi:P-loop containing nucleoside triphosphate hydrolase protein [Didymella exigua CBS 183.55]|uniref:Signal recognition particle receptor subunit beta n=1 Tax=Didymella exigua CBS 183.55 TaxID=1150837 RepID=A0A6A5RCR3_9PLEO|nr:P-loop containing nucleoside triphosphate hydrolase protein [Didymella exigua CBS 183.55]KAF1925179.1 P-loop containing nucleoside triphosphate hydrolase protein [Didymella exigua CBS 183.55]